MELVAAIEDALRVLQDLGAELIDLDLPIPLKDYRLCTRVIGSAEAFAAHEQDFLARRGEMGKALRDKLMGGMFIRAADYLKAVRWRRELTVRTDADSWHHATWWYVPARCGSHHRLRTLRE